MLSGLWRFARVGALVFGLCFTCGCELKTLNADDADAPPKVLGFHPRQSLSGIDRRFRTHLGDARTDADGIVWATYASAFPDVRYLGADVFVDYPDLTMKDVAPVFGRLYRVTEVIDSSRTGGRGSLTMERLEPKELPQGVSLQDGSFAIPLRVHNRGRARLHDIDVFVESIAKGEGKNALAVALLSMRPWAPPQDKTTVRVRAGDVLTIGKVRHKVLNVVPRDPTTHVIGWVELDPNPLKEDGPAKKQDPSAVKKPDEPR